MDKEAQRLLAKYQGHVPVICGRWDAPDAKGKKFLIPAGMSAKEFVAIVRQKCSWATESSTVCVGEDQGTPESGTASDIYAAHKGVDGILHVLVKAAVTKTGGEASGSFSPLETGMEEEQQQLPVQLDAATEERTEMEEEDAVEERMTVKRFSELTQACVFHMPDCDADEQTMSAEGKKVRQVVSKYPDHLPVLIRQAATAGLPPIDKKLLVPRAMTCAALQVSLPRHLKLPESPLGKWSGLRVYMGQCYMGDEAEPIMQDAKMSDVYEQFVDEDDGGLHLTLGLVGGEEGGEADEEPASRQARKLEELEEALKVCQEACAEKDRNLGATESRTMAALDAAEGRAADAEWRAVDAERKAADAEMELHELQDHLRMAQEAFSIERLEAQERIKELAGHLESAEAKWVGEAQRAAAASAEAMRVMRRDHEFQLKALMAQHASELEAAALRSPSKAPERNAATPTEKASTQAVANALAIAVERHTDQYMKAAEDDGFIDLGIDGEVTAGGICVDEFEVISGAASP